MKTSFTSTLAFSDKKSRTFIFLKLTYDDTMNFHFISLFPEIFESYLASSILKRAVDDKKVSFSYYNPRDFVKNKAKQVDDKPYGGGPGMVIQAEPILKAIEKAIGKKKNILVIHLSPGGKPFTTAEAQKIQKKYKHVVIICGRYEGIDSRVKEIFPGVEYTIGDYVLTGGELPAMVITDAVSRYVPGVLGKFESNETERTASRNMYTRPEVLKYKKKTYGVPQVLMGGDHKKIEEWRKEN